MLNPLQPVSKAKVIGPSLDNPAVVRWGRQIPIQNPQQGLTACRRTIHHMRQIPPGFVKLHRPHLRKRRVDRAVRSKGRCREGGFGRFMHQYQELTPFSEVINSATCGLATEADGERYF